MAAERNPWSELNPEYVVNEKGERIKVLLDIQEYLDLLEEVEYLADVEAAQAALDTETEFMTLEDYRAARKTRQNQ
jgi:hypothetical protein